MENTTKQSEVIKNTNNNQSIFTDYKNYKKLIHEISLINPWFKYKSLDELESVIKKIHADEVFNCTYVELQAFIMKHTKSINELELFIDRKVVEESYAKLDIKDLSKSTITEEEINNISSLEKYDLNEFIMKHSDEFIVGHTFSSDKDRENFDAESDGCDIYEPDGREFYNLSVHSIKVFKYHLDFPKPKVDDPLSWYLNETLIDKKVSV